MRPRPPTWSAHRGPTKAIPSRTRRPRSSSFLRASRKRSRPYFGVSIRLRRMKRSRVGRPPCRGGGAMRISSGTPSGGAATGSETDNREQILLAEGQLAVLRFVGVLVDADQLAAQLDPALAERPARAHERPEALLHEGGPRLG